MEERPAKVHLWREGEAGSSWRQPLRREARQWRPGRLRTDPPPTPPHMPRTLSRSSLSLHHTHTLSPKMRSNSLGRKKDSVGWGWEAGGQQFPSYFPSATPLTPPIFIAGTAAHLTSNDILYSQGCGYITHAPNPNPSALYSGTVRSQLETKGKRRKGLHLKCMRLNYSPV